MAMYQRQALRVTHHLRLDRTVNGFVGRVVADFTLPAVQLRLPYLSIEYRQVGDCLLRIRDDTAQQRQPALPEALDGRRLEQVGGIGQCCTQPSFALKGVQREVELRGMNLYWQCFQGQVRHQGMASIPLADTLMVVHHLEQRVMAQAALRTQGLDQLLERQVLVVLPLHHGLAHLLQEVAEACATVHLATQHLGIGEEADQPFGFHPVAVGNRHTDTDVVLARVPVQQHLVGSQQQHEQGHPLLTRYCVQCPRQVGIERQAQARAAIALLRRAGKVQRQLQGIGVASQLRGPVLQLTLALACFHPAPLPDGVVAVLHRQRWQAGFATFECSPIELDQVTEHDFDRPAVRNDVVHDHHQHVVVLALTRHPGAQQRSLGQVEGLAGQALHKSVERFVRAHLQLHLHLLQHFLHGCFSAVLQACAKHPMAPEQRCEAVLQRHQVEVATQAQRERNMIGITVRFQLPEEPLTFLGVGQRQRFELVTERWNRQLRRRDAFGQHGLQVTCSFIQWQRDEPPRDPCGNLLVHHTSSISSSRDSSLLNLSPVS